VSILPPLHDMAAIDTFSRHLNQNLTADEIQLTIGSSSDGVPSMELPVDDEAHAGMSRPITMRTTSGISAASQPTTRLGPFCRAAEAAHLLGKVLDLVAESSYTNQIDQEKSRPIDEQLQKLAMILLQQAVNGWEECCAAIGLNLRYVSHAISVPSLMGSVHFSCFMSGLANWSKIMGMDTRNN